MNQLQAQVLTEKTFQKYGRFANFTAPGAPYLGAAPVCFYRDLLPLATTQGLAASVTQVQPMPLVVDTMECHTSTGEGFMSLDVDACFCVGAATAEPLPDVETFEVFLLAAGTMVYLHPGVWHYAPYPVGTSPLHSLVLLPERTYANDCTKVGLPPSQQCHIVL